MLQLCLLLCRLPPLTISHTWSHRWLMDLPLQLVLPPRPASRPLPLRYLVSDIVEWDPTCHCFFLHQYRLPTSLHNVIESIWNPNTSSPHQLQLLQSITITIPRSSHQAPPELTTPAVAHSILPSLAHWSIKTSNKTTTKAPQLSLAQLRRLWHPSWQHMLNRPRPPEYPKPICFLYPPSFWTRFWKISLPHKAVTPWWRLLLNSVSTRSKLHRLIPDQYPSPACPICRTGCEEDINHLFVDCQYKRLFWLNALHLLQLDDLLPTTDSIWHALVTFSSLDNQPLSDSALCRLGCIIAVVWRYHWTCVLADEPWFTSVAMEMLTSHVLFSSFVPRSSITLP